MEEQNCLSLSLSPAECLNYAFLHPISEWGGREGEGEREGEREGGREGGGERERGGVE